MGLLLLFSGWDPSKDSIWGPITAQGAFFPSPGSCQVDITLPRTLQRDSRSDPSVDLDSLAGLDESWGGDAGRRGRGARAEDAAAVRSPVSPPSRARRDQGEATPAAPPGARTPSTRCRRTQNLAESCAQQPAFSAGARLPSPSPGAPARLLLLWAPSKGGETERGGGDTWRFYTFWGLRPPPRPLPPQGIFSSSSPASSALPGRAARGAGVGGRCLPETPQCWQPAPRHSSKRRSRAASPRHSGPARPQPAAGSPPRPPLLAAEGTARRRTLRLARTGKRERGQRGTSTTHTLGEREAGSDPDADRPGPEMTQRGAGRRQGRGPTWAGPALRACRAGWCGGAVDRAGLVPGAAGNL